MSDLTSERHDATSSRLIRLADVMAGIAAQVCGECYRRRRGEQLSPATVKRDMLRVAVNEYLAARDSVDVVYFSREVRGDAEPSAESRPDIQRQAEATTR